MIVTRIQKEREREKNLYSHVISFILDIQFIYPSVFFCFVLFCFLIIQLCFPVHVFFTCHYSVFYFFPPFFLLFRFFQYRFIIYFFLGAVHLFVPSRVFQG